MLRFYSKINCYYVYPIVRNINLLKYEIFILQLCVFACIKT